MQAFTTSLPLGLPNTAIQPPDSFKYITMNHMPNRTQRVAIGSLDQHRFLGIMQINVWWPNDDGEDEPRALAGDIADWFDADTRMVSGGLIVRSTQHPVVGASRPGQPAMMTPVSVMYECYA